MKVYSELTQEEEEGLFEANAVNTGGGGGRWRRVYERVRDDDAARCIPRQIWQQETQHKSSFTTEQTSGVQ